MVYNIQHFLTPVYQLTILWLPGWKERSAQPAYSVLYENQITYLHERFAARCVWKFTCKFALARMCACTQWSWRGARQKLTESSHIIDII